MKHIAKLSSFNADMRALEKGVELNIKGKMKKLEGGLLCVGGDSPAVCVMFGSREN